jgi:hypothetical protein
MDYLEADDRFFEIVKTTATRMFAAVKVTAYPDSYRAMFGFCSKTNSLKTAIFDMVDSQNPYALKALFRCCCDHYLKFTYVWVRFLREGTDAVGTEYFSYCGAIELRDYAAALVLAEALVGKQVVAGIVNAVATACPKAVGLSNQELEAASARFRYRTILRFLKNEMPGAFSGERSFLPKVVPSYALLSSFVHGGPWSDLEMYTFGEEAALEQCRRDAELVCSMTASVLMFTAMVVSRELPEHAIVATEVKAVLDAFQEEVAAR